MLPEMNKKRVLIIVNTLFIGGAEKSLIGIINSLEDYDLILVLPKGIDLKLLSDKIRVYNLPMIWFYRTLNPWIYLTFLWNLLTISFHLLRIVETHKVDVVYANSIKSLIYTLIVRFVLDVKIIGHFRDRVVNKYLTKLLILGCNISISVSDYIYNQIPSPLKKKTTIYAGIDTEIWSPYLDSGHLRKEIFLTNNCVLVAMIGQITRWKNQTDFIKAAKIILEGKNKVHFLILGDDLSGRESEYKAELMSLKVKLKLDFEVSFLGNRIDIREVLNQVDVMIHPSINEPFGRVIIEAMSMAIPVVAYNCGGPKEIIKNNETGFLVDAYDYVALANKSLELICNENLRQRMGKNGRKRIVEKFNIKCYEKKINKLFKAV